MRLLKGDWNGLLPVDQPHKRGGAWGQIVGREESVGRRELPSHASYGGRWSGCLCGIACSSTSSTMMRRCGNRSSFFSVLRVFRYASTTRQNRSWRVLGTYVAAAFSPISECPKWMDSNFCGASERAEEAFR